jgi:hypothetical protein
MEKMMDIHSSYYYLFSTLAQIVGFFVSIGSVFLLNYLFNLNKSIITKSKTLLDLEIFNKPELLVDKENLVILLKNFSNAVKIESMKEISFEYNIMKEAIKLNINKDIVFKEALKIIDDIDYNFWLRKGAISDYMRSFILGSLTIIVCIYSIFCVPFDFVKVNMMLMWISLGLGVFSFTQIFYLVRRSFH